MPSLRQGTPSPGLWERARSQPMAEAAYHRRRRAQRADSGQATNAAPARVGLALILALVRPAQHA